MRLYVASSWRNEFQPDVVARLRTEGHEVYDFRNPPSGTGGFSWAAIDPEWRKWTPRQFVEALRHETAERGFRDDADALLWADGVVLVQPCGASSHLELGWAIGEGKKAAVLLAAGEPDVLQVPGTLSAEARDRIRQQWDEAQRFKRPVILEAGIKLVSRRGPEPELMYKLADALCVDLDEVVRAVAAWEKER